MNSRPRCRRSSRTFPSIPLPSLISVCSERDTTSLDASSSYCGAYFNMKRSPSELRRCAPSPRAASDSSMPVRANVVGWYWTISISIIGTPARHARARPSPVQMIALVEGSNTRPAPPAAMITVFAQIECKVPVLISSATTPTQRPSSMIKSVTNHSSYTFNPCFRACS